IFKKLLTFLCLSFDIIVNRSNVSVSFKKLFKMNFELKAKLSQFIRLMNSAEFENSNDDENNNDEIHSNISDSEASVYSDDSDQNETSDDENDLSTQNSKTLQKNLKKIEQNVQKQYHDKSFSIDAIISAAEVVMQIFIYLFQQKTDLLF